MEKIVLNDIQYDLLQFGDDPKNLPENAIVGFEQDRTYEVKELNENGRYTDVLVTPMIRYVDVKTGKIVGYDYGISRKMQGCLLSAKIEKGLMATGTYTDENVN